MCLLYLMVGSGETKNLLDVLAQYEIGRFCSLGFNWIYYRTKTFCDTLQVSPDTDSLISNGYHNDLKMCLSCDFLPVFKIRSYYRYHTIFVVQSSKSYSEYCQIVFIQKNLMTPLYIYYAVIYIRFNFPDLCFI